MKFVPTKAIEFTIFNEEKNSLLVDHYPGGPGYLYHFHPGMELTLVRGSIGRRIIGNKIGNYRSRDLVLVGPTIPHTWDSETVIGDPDSASVTVLHFSAKSVGYDLLSKPELEPVMKMLNESGQGLLFSPETIALAEPLMEQIVTAEPFRRLMLFLELLALLADRGYEPVCRQYYNPDQNPADQEKMGEVLAWLRDRRDRNVRLQDAAEAANMSQSSFCRFFKRVSGTSFIDYYNREKIDRACLLLTGTKMKVIDICQMAGYSNQSHFNRQFQKVTGLTPVQYRDNDRTGE